MFATDRVTRRKFGVYSSKSNAALESKCNSLHFLDLFTTVPANISIGFN